MNYLQSLADALRLTDSQAPVWTETARTEPKKPKPIKVKGMKRFDRGGNVALTSRHRKRHREWSEWAFGVDPLDFWHLFNFDRGISERYSSRWIHHSHSTLELMRGRMDEVARLLAAGERLVCEESQKSMLSRLNTEIKTAVQNERHPVPQGQPIRTINRGLVVPIIRIGYARQMKNRHWRFFLKDDVPAELHESSTFQDCGAVYD